jgi:hypothetical protein
MLDCVLHDGCGGAAAGVARSEAAAGVGAVVCQLASGLLQRVLLASPSCLSSSFAPHLSCCLPPPSEHPGWGGGVRGRRTGGGKGTGKGKGKADAQLTSRAQVLATDACQDMGAHAQVLSLLVLLPADQGRALGQALWRKTLEHLMAVLSVIQRAAGAPTGVAPLDSQAHGQSSGAI